MTKPNTPSIIVPPNTGPPIEKVWMFISRDKEGHENVCGGYMGALGTQPMITGNPRVLEIMRPIAAFLAEESEPLGRTIHLLEFTNRQEITEWR